MSFHLHGAISVMLWLLITLNAANNSKVKYLSIYWSIFLSFINIWFLTQLSILSVKICSNASSNQLNDQLAFSYALNCKFVEPQFILLMLSYLISVVSLVLISWSFFYDVLAFSILAFHVGTWNGSNVCSPCLVLPHALHVWMAGIS